ncbi:MAG: hypothetical protein GEU80_00740 [Dehalococcoidia bacterium]|nr:hypothetical protein [Dehalococcoidia bacterium]
MVYVVIVALVVVWLLAAWLAARLAYFKGRSLALGAIIGLALPVVGLAVVWFIPPDLERMVLRQSAAQQHQSAVLEDALEERDAEVRRTDYQPGSRRRRRRSQR